MAGNIDSILVGPAVVSAGIWVTAGGAGSLVDFGYTKEPTQLNTTFEDFAISPEQLQGESRSVPTGLGFTLVVPIWEASLENIRKAMHQPVANITGAVTLQVGERAEAYYQVQIVGKGVGALPVRTITLWKCTPTNLGELSFAKKDAQTLTLTMKVLEDPSVTAAGKFFKIVDSV